MVFFTFFRIKQSGKVEFYYCPLSFTGLLVGDGEKVEKRDTNSPCAEKK